MTGRPKRLFPKTDMQFRVPPRSFEAVRPLVENAMHPFRSLSEFVESLVFLFQSIYFEPEDSDIVKLLEKTKQDHLADFYAPQRPGSKLVHVKIDAEARDFINLYYRRHRSEYTSKSELVACMLFAAGTFAHGEQQRKYLLKRISNALSAHPACKEGRTWHL